MAVLSDYKGIDVVEGATGAGGAALTNDFKELADRAPRNSVLDPGATDDVGAGFFPGSLWFNVATETMWVCTDATTDAAVWKSFYARTENALKLIPDPYETGADVLINGGLGVGTDDPKAWLHAVDSTIVGAAVAAVADGDLGTSQVNVWLDETSGSEKLKFKAKLSGGSVKSGEVSLTGSTIDLSSAVILSPATSARNTVTPSAATAVPLTLKGGQSDSESAGDSNSAGATLASVSPAGTLDTAGLSISGVASNEYVRDLVGATLVEGTGIDINVDDGGNTITIAATTDPATLVTLSPATSARNTVTPSAATAVPLTLKGAASQSANMLEVQNAAGTTLTSVSSNGTVSAASLEIGGIASDEYVRDVVGATLLEGTGIDLNFDDSGNAITISATAAVPTGTMMMYGGSTTPTGWLLCDGAAVSRSTYANLFAALGGASSPWGLGDGSTTFNVPDLRSRTPVGAGQGSGLSSRTLGASGGSETHTLIISEMPSHTHSYNLVNSEATYTTGPSYNSAGPSYTSGFTTQATGGGTSHNNMQPWRGVNFIIKT